MKNTNTHTGKRDGQDIKQKDGTCVWHRLAKDTATICSGKVEPGKKAYKSGTARTAVGEGGCSSGRMINEWHFGGDKIISRKP